MDFCFHDSTWLCSFNQHRYRLSLLAILLFSTGALSILSWLIILSYIAPVHLLSLFIMGLCIAPVHHHLISIQLAPLAPVHLTPLSIEPYLYSTGTDLSLLVMLLWFHTTVGNRAPLGVPGGYGTQHEGRGLSSAREIGHSLGGARGQRLRTNISPRSLRAASAGQERVLGAGPRPDVSHEYCWPGFVWGSSEGSESRPVCLGRRRVSFFHIRFSSFPSFYFFIHCV